MCVSVSAISYQVDFILITQCLWSPVVQKIVIPVLQQGKKSRDPQWDEFIRSVGQLGQLIMLLSCRRGGGGGRGGRGRGGGWQGREEVWVEIGRERGEGAMAGGGEEGGEIMHINEEEKKKRKRKG